MTIHCKTECDLCNESIDNTDPNLNDWRTVNSHNSKGDFIQYHVCPKHDTAELLEHDTEQ